MQKINLREIYPDIYKTDIFVETTDEVQEVFLTDIKAEEARQRQMLHLFSSSGVNFLHMISAFLTNGSIAEICDKCESAFRPSSSFFPATKVIRIRMSAFGNIGFSRCNCIVPA